MRQWLASFIYLLRARKRIAMVRDRGAEELVELSAARRRHQEIMDAADRAVDRAWRQTEEAARAAQKEPSRPVKVG